GRGAPPTSRSARADGAVYRLRSGATASNADTRLNGTMAGLNTLTYPSTPSMEVSALGTWRVARPPLVGDPGSSGRARLGAGRSLSPEAMAIGFLPAAPPPTMTEGGADEGKSSWSTGRPSECATD